MKISTPIAWKLGFLVASMSVVGACAPKKPAPHKAAPSEPSPHETTAVATQVNLREASPQSLDLGQGVNSLGGLSYSGNLSKCLKFAPVTGAPPEGANATQLTLQMARHEKEVLEALSKPLLLKKDASAELSTSQAADSLAQNELFMAHDLSRPRTMATIYPHGSFYAVLRVQKALTSARIASLAGIEEAAKVAAEKGEFFGVCGDRFVSQELRGAEVTAVIRCDAGSEQTRNDWLTTMADRGGVFSLENASAVQATLDALRTRAENKCVIDASFQGGVTKPEHVDATNFVRTALEYVDRSDSSSSRAIEIDTLSYTAVQNLEMRAEIVSKNDLTLKSQRQILSSRQEYISILIDEIRRLIDAGKGENSALLNPIWSLVEEMRGRSDRCIRNASLADGCKSTATWPIPPRP